MFGEHPTRLVCLLAVLALVSMPLGCADDEPKEEPPEIPPASTFVMDFSDFASETAALAVDNWHYAAGNVAIWNAFITIGLAVPVAAFLEALSHEPVRQTDGTWVWDYNFYVGQVLHVAELRGWVESDVVFWEMYISKQGFFEDFLWYSGESAVAGTEGTWTLYASPENPTPLIGILWHAAPEEGTADIKYTNIVPDGPENGGYIFYGVTDGSPYDAFYDIYNKGLENHTNIEWNRPGMAGRVADALHFDDDGEWHCWNDAHQDVDCPAM
jgi:hypothetical protein